MLHLYIHSLDVHLCGGVHVPAEIHHQLFGLPSTDLEVVPLIPLHKILDRFSFDSVVPDPDEADHCRVIREPLQMAVG